MKATLWFGLLVIVMFAGCAEHSNPAGGTPATELAALRITVTDSGGNPLAQVAVAVYTAGMTLLNARTTDSAGSARVDSLPRDSLWIIADKWGYGQTQAMVVLTDSLRELHLTMAPNPYCALQVLITDSDAVGIAHAKAVVLAENSDTLALGYTDSTGSLRFDSLSQTEYVTIRVSKPGYTAASRWFRLSQAVNPLQITLIPATPSNLLDFTLVTLDGDTLNGQDLLGQVVVVEFWDTWCAPCRQQLSTFVVLDSLYRSEGLFLIGIAFGRYGSDAVRAYVESHSILFPIAIITDEFEAPFGEINAIPTSFVIDRQDVLSDHVIGAHAQSWWTETLWPLLYP